MPSRTGTAGGEQQMSEHNGTPGAFALRRGVASASMAIVDARWRRWRGMARWPKSTPTLGNTLQRRWHL